MKRLRLAILGGVASMLAVASAAFFFWPTSLDTKIASAPPIPDLVEKGRYLATAADCRACHTRPGGAPFAGGRAFKLPFGTIYSPNITPDAETGIGRWTDPEFVRAMQKGVGRNGEELYPAFPYTAYALLSTNDVLAIRAYMASLQPIAAPKPNNTLIFPFNQRYTLRAWKALFMPAKPWQPSPTHDAEWNRGEYLAEALAHCGECHTPRNLLYATESSKHYAGAVVDGWKAYNITSDKETGIGSWSDEQLRQYLSTGHAEGRGTAGGPMAEVVDLSLRHLTGRDINSLVSYLRSVPAASSLTAAPDKLTSASKATNPDTGLGSNVFASACAGCHLTDGAGRQSTFADLRGARSVNDPSGTNVIRAILQGSHIGTPKGPMFMPPFANAYSDEEVASVANFVIGSFGRREGLVTASSVKQAREK